MNMENELDPKQYYRTSDLALTAVLSLEYPIVDIDRTNYPRAIFIFKKTKKLDQQIESYWNGELRIEPQKFANQIKFIKTRIYSNE